MFKNKKLKNLKKAFFIGSIVLLLSSFPLKAENDHNSESLNLRQEMILTITANQFITPLEKPSLEASSIYADSNPPKSYDFSIKRSLPETKYPETYKRIQIYQKTHSFEKALFEASLIANLALNAADYFSTREALQYEGLKEGNPLMEPFVKNDMTFAAVKIGITMTNYFMMKKLFKRNKALAWIASIASNLALSYVVSSNTAHIYEARNR
jgi:hypothetical protein